MVRPCELLNPIPSSVGGASLLDLDLASKASSSDLSKKEAIEECDIVYHLQHEHLL